MNFMVKTSKKMHICHLSCYNKQIFMHYCDIQQVVHDVTMHTVTDIELHLDCSSHQYQRNCIIMVPK